METLTPPARARCRRTAGFTVAELVATLSILAIVGAVAVPIFASWRDHYAFDSTVRQMTFEIGRARMQAIGQNAFVRLRLSGAGQFVRERSDDGVTFTPDGAAIALPASMSAVLEGDAPSFNRQGLANGDSSIVLSDHSSANRATLHSNVLGRVTTTVTTW